ncbi:MAG: hypothetical protein WCR45_08895 [Bacteroidaceae bacterium]
MAMVRINSGSPRFQPAVAIPCTRTLRTTTMVAMKRSVLLQFVVLRIIKIVGKWESQISFNQERNHEKTK